VRLVYIDESARDVRFYFFGALIADHEAVRFIERGLDEIAELVSRHCPGFDSGSEFHAASMFHGRDSWRSVPLAWRIKASDLVAKVLARSTASFVFRGLNVAAQQARYRHPHPPHLLTLAHTLAEVQRQLGSLDDDALGLVLADEHHAASHARRSLRDLKAAAIPGYTSDKLRCIADTIYFGPSHESRLLQAADVATYFLNRTKTVIERDVRSERAVQKIVANIRRITVSEYVWYP
jgi:hypothetical protein